MVEFRQVTKRYGDLAALREVSFAIESGGIVGLLGPNGAGKTTTMRIMTGFMEPSSGEVLFDGVPFGPDSVALKRRIGYLPESAPAYGDMLAWDYLAWEAALHGLDVEQRVGEVIRQVGLQSHAHMPIRALSKGYRQRVGLAHTLLHDPEFLVLDEPTSGLDPNQIIEVRNLIRRIAQTKTVILSTHIMQEVEALCDRVILIHRGSIRYDGAISALTAGVNAGGAPPQRIRVGAAAPSFDALRAVLGAVPGVLAVEPADTDPSDGDGAADGPGVVSAAVLADPAVEVRPAIAEALAAAKPAHALYELMRERTTVEELFHELTSDAGAPVAEAEGAGVEATESGESR